MPWARADAGPAMAQAKYWDGELKTLLKLDALVKERLVRMNKWKPG